MIDISAEFEPAKQAIGWAEDAIRDLDLACKRFFQPDIAKIVVERDYKTGENVQKVRLIRPLPAELARRATEALTNTRHAFDQATFAARNVTSGPSVKSIYFPWAQSIKDLEHILNSRGLDKRLWAVFRKHEPYPRSNDYPGGDDVIRALAKLANRKHTVGLATGAHISLTRFPDIIGKDLPVFKMLRPDWDPVKNEAELLRWIGNVGIYGDYYLEFEVLFKDTGLAKMLNAKEGLTAFAKKVKEVTESLEARCIELQR